MKSIIYSLIVILLLSGCNSKNNTAMTNLEIVKSTYEGKLRKKTEEH
jgi:uncharacterized protein YceK